MEKENKQCLHIVEHYEHIIAFFTMTQQSPSGPRPPHYRGFRITLSYTHHTRKDSSGREISPT